MYNFIVEVWGYWDGRYRCIDVQYVTARDISGAVDKARRNVAYQYGYTDSSQLTTHASMR